MKKTKICCLNLRKEICDELSKTFEVYNGSLGNVVNVEKHNLSHDKTRLLPNNNFPKNIHEYEVFISDLRNFTTIGYSESEHTKTDIVGDSAYYFISKYPSTLFDPIPYACYWLKNLTRKGKTYRPIINIIFQYDKKEINYTIQNIVSYNKEEKTLTNYSNIMDFTEETIYGNEIIFGDSKIAHTLFDRFSNEIEYHQTFIDPTSNINIAIPNVKFIPLLKNKHGQIVSYIWISDVEITYMLPQLKSKKELLDILFKEELFQHYSEYFPEIETISWKNKIQYYLPGQQELENKKQDIIKKYNEDIANIEKAIEDNSKKNAFVYNVLTETGDVLVKSVIDYLKWLGFDHAIEKDKTAENGLLEEDIQVDLGDKGLLIIEVKGINGTSKDSECSQISKIKYRRCKERNRFDVFALYIVNNERNVEPLKRTTPPFNTNQIQDAINDERGLMYTWQLFNLYFNIENGFLSKEEARNHFLQNGLVDFTPEFKEMGIPYKYFQDHTVICIELQNCPIQVGDELAYEMDGKYYPMTVVELQQDKKTIKEVSNGEVGIKVNKKIPEKKALYFVKHINN